MLTYFGRVRFKGHLPGGVVAVGVGTLIAWMTGLAPVGTQPAAAALHLPVPVFGDLVRVAQRRTPRAVPLGHRRDEPLQRARVAAEHRVGRGRGRRLRHAVRRSSSTASAASPPALFGSAFPTTIYIGHPGWKALGARAGYSVLNGVFVTIICLTGTLAWIAWAIPIDAGMAIVLWIGMMIVAQAFQATPREHAPAVVVGLLPGIGAWGALMAKNGLRAAGLGGPAGPFSESLIGEFQKSDTWIHGAFAHRAGLPLHRDDPLGRRRRRHRTPLERRRRLVRLRRGAVGDGPDALLHSGRSRDTALKLAPAWPFVIGYAGWRLLFFLAQWITEEGGEH